MYACLFTVRHSIAELLALAQQFSPAVEQADDATVVFSIAPLRKLLGSPHQIASEISRAGYERKLEANLAIASNPDSAILLARYYAGVTLVTPGEEKIRLGAIPLAALFASMSPRLLSEAKAQEKTGIADLSLLDVLHRWGLKTCEDLAALPEQGVLERLGSAGAYLRNLACGALHRPLRLAPPESSYEEHVALEHRLELLEPLLFLLGRALQELCAKLRAQSRAARLLSTELTLEAHEPYRCALEFPVPLADNRAMLKLLQLHLERHPPQAAIIAFTVRIEPVEPRRVQNGLFLPPAPAPDKLQVTLARIAGMVGKENAGTPALLDTYRPDAFEMQPLPSLAPGRESEAARPAATLQLVVRLFRPALPARVRLIEYTPKSVLASGVKGKVLRSAGPWKTSGEWWAPTFWCREEWDVALDDGALYRIYQDAASGSWFVHGVYD